MHQEMSNSERDYLNSKIADRLYSEGWSQNEVDKYIADLLGEYDQTLDDPIDPEVQKYYLELLPRLPLLMILLLASYTMKDGTRTKLADILMICIMSD
jgi:hypothetical protein